MFSFAMSFLLDGKFGTKIFSLFEIYAVRMGKVKSTLPGRDGGLRLQGVDQTGGVYDTTITQTNGILRNYYDNYKVYSDKFIYDGSFIKLRQIIISYNIPVNGLKFAKLQSASISFVARNLATFYKQTKDFDPELLQLFDRYVHGMIDRRGFLDGAAKFAVGGMTAAAILQSMRGAYD